MYDKTSNAGHNNFVKVSILKSGFSITIYLDDLQGNNEVSSDFSEMRR